MAFTNDFLFATTIFKEEEEFLSLQYDFPS